MEEKMMALRNLLAEVLDIEAEEIKPDSHFMNDLEVDSLMALEVLVRLEKEYKVKIPEERLPSITSLQNVYDLLKEKGAVD